MHGSEIRNQAFPGTIAVALGRIDLHHQPDASLPTVCPTFTECRLAFASFIVQGAWDFGSLPVWFVRELVVTKLVRMA